MVNSYEEVFMEMIHVKVAHMSGLMGSILVKTRPQ